MRNTLSFVVLLLGAYSNSNAELDSRVEGACINFVEPVPNELRVHIPEDQTPIYQHNPPVSGEHYPIWARWQIHEQTLPRGYWVHNLEHGGVILLYRPDAPQQIIDALRRVFDAIPLEQECVDAGIPHARTVLTSDPLLDYFWAVTVSGPEPNPEQGDLGFGYVITDNCIESEQALVDFAVAYRNMSAESICDEGFIP